MGSMAMVSATMKNNQFLPADIRVTPGTMITWVNDDQVPHAINADPKNLVSGGPNSDTDHPSGIAKGESWTWMVPHDAAPGTKWFYYCRFHGTPGDGKSPGKGMVGIISVEGVHTATGTSPSGTPPSTGNTGGTVH